MAGQKRICLSRLHWERLESHLPEGICEKLTGDEACDPAQDCRVIANEATYRAILAVANVHCPDLVQIIENEKHRSDSNLEVWPPQVAARVRNASEMLQPLDVQKQGMAGRQRLQNPVRWPVVLVLAFALAELCYLAFFARCVPLLTDRSRCQPLSLMSQPVVIAQPGVTWSALLNTAAFVFEIFSVCCLLGGSALRCERLQWFQLVPASGVKLTNSAAFNSLDPLSICGAILLMIGLLLHLVGGLL